MHEGDGHAAVADRRGDALDRAGADVAAGEDPGHARLEQVRVALERPAARRAHVGAREDVAALVQRDSVGKPAGVGVCADEDEEPARRWRAVSPVERSRTSIASSAPSP